MKKGGFTLIELMVVIFIVGILAAVAVPLMRGRIDAAKWSEGRAIMGTIATGLRAHVAEEGSNFTAVPTLAQLGFAANDLDGTYFTGGESDVGNFSCFPTVEKLVSRSPKVSRPVRAAIPRVPPLLSSQPL